MFNLLHPRVVECLRELGFERPTPIQQAAIPEILSGKHCLLVAPTGIGKTEAALLPIFSRMLTQGGRAVYITPLRALNRDLMRRLEWWAEKLGIKIAVRHGDTAKAERRRQVLEPPDIFITTPETLQVLLTGKLLRKHLRNVKYAVVDEIHELAESKRGAQLACALERLYAITRREFQRIGISATVSNPEKIAGFLAHGREVRIVHTLHPKQIEVRVEYVKPQKQDREIAAKILSSVSVASRVRRILELLEHEDSLLIFVNTRETAEALASRFNILVNTIGIHHSSLSQEARIRAEEEFKAGKLKALIATSSLELGIDIGSVSLVVQYKSPRQVARLVQRVGRAGHRLGLVSRGVIVATDAEDILESLVIARKAKAGEIEDISPWEKPLDVLAHQLVGLGIEYRRVKKEHALLLFRRSYPFRELEFEELEEVLSLLERLGIVWVEEEYYGIRRGAHEYYYENLSTIPEERKFIVKNFASGERIGTLDERFVASYVQLGERIIFKGSPWKVLSITEDEIKVEPLSQVEGAIPSWVGEEIPVPFEVAQEVARLKSRALKEDYKALEQLPCDEYTKRVALSKIRHHRRRGFPIGDDKTVVVELHSKMAVLHGPFGNNVNQTLGRLYSLYLNSILGTSVSFRADAYRIVIQSPVELKEEHFSEIFHLSSEGMEKLLSSGIKRTSLFRWKFSQVAKRFGVLKKDFSYTELKRMDRVIRLYEDTALYREAVKEVFRDNMDVERAKEIVDKIRSGEIKYEFFRSKEISPFAEIGLQNYGEVVVPERAELFIARAVKRRILNRRITLFCLYCGKWHESFTVKNIEPEIRCGNCSARMLAVLKRDERELMKLYRRYKRGEKLTPEEWRKVKSLQLSANLFLSYGIWAVYAQAAVGIGPDVAKRVLARARDEDSLFREIVKEERNYARTRVFWE